MNIPGKRRLAATIRRVQKKLAPSKGLILMYHRVADTEVDPWSLCVTPERFAEQMAVLSTHYHPLSLQQLVQTQKQQRIPAGAVAVTFDDGYADNLHQAKPILARYNIPATVFVITGALGRTRRFWWDELAQAILRPGKLPEQLTLRFTLDEIADLEGTAGKGTIDKEKVHWDLGAASHYTHQAQQRDLMISVEQAPSGSRLAFYYSLWQTLLPLPERIREQALKDIFCWADVDLTDSQSNRALSPDELADLDEGELIEIGAHTVTHSLLSVQTATAQKAEIQQSKSDLEKILNRPVTSFSYPFGNRNHDSVKIARSAGFDCACSTVADVVWQQSDPFQLPRFGVQNWTGEDFSQQLRRWLHG